LRDVVRQVDDISRISGSKFGIVLTKCDDEQVLIACERFRNRLRNHVFQTNAGPVSVTVSISAVVMPQHASSPREAIGNAAIALEEARRDRIRSVAVYHHDWRRDQRRQADARVAQNVVCAIAEDRLRLAFQPVVDATSGETVFHEALIRIQAHDGSLVDAGSFITAAERLGVIRMVDMRALSLAIDELRRSPDIVLSVNVSNDAAQDPAWLRELAASVEATPDLAPRLIVEITESQATLDLENTRALVEAVRHMGCRIAIDDFGAGYTSFRNLKQLPFDIIKIDGEFARDLADDRHNQVFIRALIDIAHAFDAKIVVEWVADAETAALLKSWGVDYLQGFAVGEPTVSTPWKGD
jgi:EAL domain-containing protein (putative c-di-GMP-specific phosphodiesterase class I)